MTGPRPNRRSPRLRGYDYRQPAAYFVTVSTKDRAPVFGVIRDATVELNDTGEIIRSVWQSLPGRFPGVTVDQFIVMPDHVHGIVHLAGAGVMNPAPTAPGSAGVMSPAPTAPGAGVMNPAPTEPGSAGVMNPAPTEPGAGVMNPAPTLGEVVRVFKAVSARLIRVSGQPEFAWQRNYYEHVVRADADLHRVRQYILDNPAAYELKHEEPPYPHLP